MSLFAIYSSKYFFECKITNKIRYKPRFSAFCAKKVSNYSECSEVKPMLLYNDSKIFIVSAYSFLRELTGFLR